MVILVLLQVIGFGIFPVNSQSKCSSGAPRSREDRREAGVHLQLGHRAELFAPPGSTHRVPILVENLEAERVHLVVLFQETFPAQTFSGSVHAELVRTVTPDRIDLDGKGMAVAYVNLHISHYVPPRYRSKVTVLMKQLLQNITNPEVPLNWSRDISFYFTVVEANLRQYDQVPPQCSELVGCWKETCGSVPRDQCGEVDWEARMTIRDRGSGLRSIKAEWPQDHRVEPFYRSFTVGMTDPLEVQTTLSCCTLGVKLRVEDVAANSVICSLGKVPAAAFLLSSPPAHVLSILAAAILWL